MRRRALALAVAGLFALGACEQAPDKATEAAAPTPAPPAAPAPAPEVIEEPAADLEPARDAAELANQIEKAPDEAEQILSKAGLDEEQFIEKLYDIAEDPDLSAEYARLYQPASEPG